MIARFPHAAGTRDSGELDPFAAAEGRGGRELIARVELVALSERGLHEPDG